MLFKPFEEVVLYLQHKISQNNQIWNSQTFSICVLTHVIVVVLLKKNEEHLEEVSNAKNVIVTAALIHLRTTWDPMVKVFYAKLIIINLKYLKLIPTPQINSGLWNCLTYSFLYQLISCCLLFDVGHVLFRIGLQEMLDTAPCFLQ